MTLNKGDVLQARYRVVSLLGKGGMGAVYRAWDIRLNVPVALKEMTAQPNLEPHTLAQLRQQFEQEAMILARLNHPHLVRVSDFFEESGNAYLVMDFVEGESLYNRLKREGAQPEKLVLTWATQLLDALAYCHSQGIIHRDVKPQNVIIRPDGRVVLVDFGLVKLWDPRDPNTKTAMRGMGTPEYAPPEQYDAQTGHTDPRSDLYSLGALLYHALAGQAPPTATLRIANPEQFVSVSALASGISKRTEATIMKALQLARSQRWDNAGQMAAAMGLSITAWEGQAAAVSVVTPADKLERTKKMGEAETISSVKPGPYYPPVEPADERRRRAVPLWAWLAGGLALLGLGVGAIWGLTHWRETGGAVTPTATMGAASVGNPTATSTPTAQWAPTRTLKPTRTATLVPSSTPRPTATRTATPAPTATSTPRPRPTATALPRPTSTPVPPPVTTEAPPPPTELPPTEPPPPPPTDEPPPPPPP